MDEITEKTAFDKLLNIEESGTPIETAGAWSSLVENLGFSDTEKLSSYIEGKTVLDIGSGMGGLFKEAKMRGNSARIINVNPRFALEGHAKEAHMVYETMIENIPDNIKEINQEHDRSAVAAFSNKLPIKSSSVDIIIDSKAAVYHCLFEDTFDDFGIILTQFKPNEKVLNETIDEYLRVLNKGGKVRIGGLLNDVGDGVNLLKSILEIRNIGFTEIPVINEANNLTSFELVKE